MTVTDELLACCETVGPLVYRTVGFHDDDFEQDARLAMVIAADKFDPTRGIPLAAWLRWKATRAVIDAYRVRDGDVRDSTHAARSGTLSLNGRDHVGDRLVQAGDGDAQEAIEDLVDDRARIGHLPIARTIAHFQPRGRMMIRRRLNGETGAAVARDLHVTEAAVSLTMTRFRGQIVGAGPKLSRADRASTRATRNADIVARRRRGESTKSIAKLHATTRSSVARALAAAERYDKGKR